MRLSLFSLLENHLYFFLCGLPFYDLCSFFLSNCWWFSCWFIKAFHILKKWINDLCPLKPPHFFISNNQVLPLYINFLMFSPILSLILLSCIFTLPCLCEQELRMRVKFIRKYTFEYPVSIYFVRGIWRKAEARKAFYLVSTSISKTVLPLGWLMNTW